MTLQPSTSPTGDQATAEASPPAGQQHIHVLADDLIWASRLAAAASLAGALPRPLTSPDQLGQALAAAQEPARVVIDLNGRTYDGVAAVGQAAATGALVLAVGQHEDQELRRRALDAGARRVFSYNKLFRDGPEVMRALLEGRW